MSEKYIRKNRNSYTIVKNSKNYGKFTKLENAVYARDMLVENDWILENIEKHIIGDDTYLTVIDDKIHIFDDFKTELTQDAIDKRVKQYLRNPNNSRYGLNITRVFDEYIIKKQIFGDDYIFGVYDNFEDARFVRNFLLDNQWNVNRFSQFEFDDETGTYKTVEVIDDKVYVTGSYDTYDNASKNIKNSQKEFINKIYKHKHGLSNYLYLDDLTGHVDELKEKYGISDIDEVWNLDNIDDSSDVLGDVIFNLTPWQKIIYDNMGDGEITFDELKVRLKRYESKNFDDKIIKYLNELIDLKLARKLHDDVYIRLGQ